MDLLGFKRVFDESGLTKTELASLYQVSRQTLYDWYKERSEPNQTGLVVRFDVFTEALIKVIDKGVLPMQRQIPTDLRKQRLLSMARSLHKLITPQSPQ